MKYTILNSLLLIGISINAQISIGFSDYPVIDDIHKYDTTNIKKQSQKNLSIRTDINNSFAVIEWKSNSDVQMSVFDMGGRCVKSIKPKNNYHILDLNEFSSGSYIVSIYNDNKTLSKQLVVK